MAAPGTPRWCPACWSTGTRFELGQVGTASALGIAMSLLIFGLTFGVRALIERNAT